MIIDLMQLIQEASVADEKASQLLFALFQEQKLSSEEQENIHVYLKIMAQKNPHAIYLRGMLYEHGYGVKRDLIMSFLLMREAAADGNPFAIYEVGRQFLQGIGVEKNYESALQWLEIAAESPHYMPNAMYELGRMYEQGLGVEVDLVKAQTWYERAAQKGHSQALKKVGK